MSKVIQSHLSEEALNNIMTLFWSKGFFNTSIEDLVNTTGLNRAAIYKYFDGKESLFIEMLKRYQQQITEILLTPLKQTNADLGSIRDFFVQFIQLKQKGRLSRGCSLVATASDLPSHNEIISSFIKSFWMHLKKLFKAAIDRSKKSAVLSAAVNSQSAADFLVGNVFGLLVLSRASVPLAMLKNQVHEIINYLENLKQKRRSVE